MGLIIYAVCCSVSDACTPPLLEMGMFCFLQSNSMQGQGSQTCMAFAQNVVLHSGETNASVNPSSEPQSSVQLQHPKPPGIQLQHPDTHQDIGTAVHL